MQTIRHKKTDLSFCQKFFIEKSIELLYLKSIDSYRVKLNNPKKILEELLYCLEEFELQRIKHFLTIKGKNDSKGIADEALELIADNPNYLIYNVITQKYLIQLLKTIDETNYKKTIHAIKQVLVSNNNYVTNILAGLKDLIDNNVCEIVELQKLDKTLSFLFSELIGKGYSKGFLYKLVYGIFVKSLTTQTDFTVQFENFKLRISEAPIVFAVIFRIDTTTKVIEAISEISNSNIELLNELIDVNIRNTAAFLKFNTASPKRKFVKFDIPAFDYLSALKKARHMLSEYLDIINLGLPGEFLRTYSRVLVIDSRDPTSGDFQSNSNILDGKYRVEKEYYFEYTRKLPLILGNESIIGESKEKIKSAIRYLRLGNQSTEVEHKFINYWIGLEYIFSNYESLNTINRIKLHFINAHCLAYTKRNLIAFERALNQLDNDLRARIPAFQPDTHSYFENIDFYEEIIANLSDGAALVTYRSMKLKNWFFKDDVAKAADYIKTHRKNLEIHFTRIYRLRNEIIHDAATDTNNEQIASHLRYYLTFILNEIIDFLTRQTASSLSIEDYFIANEIKLGSIEHNGFLLKDLLNVECSIDFIS